MPPTFDDDPPVSYLEDPVPVTRVVDGDTLELTIDGIEETVRLKGLDTPELYSDPPEAYAAEARAFTQAHAGTEVDLIFDSLCGTPSACRDGYGRLLAYVRVANGDDLGAEVLAHGLAEVYVFNNEQFDRRSAYEALEAQAQADGLGMWSN